MSARFESDRAITDALVAPVEPHARTWWLLVLGASATTALLPLAALYTVITGIGTWGVRSPVGWGFAIVNFVWWIGIGHAGTFLSAVLHVANQRWRSSIHRLAESMTLFAVIQAGIFPLLHMGRSWFFYWVLPYPPSFGVWPQWRSALTWDVVAILTYFTVSLIFWYLGLVPDLATRRDRARSPRARTVYAIACLGWRGSARHYHHLESARTLIAGLATALVVSVHSIVSLDFASGILPGWSSPIFPPYFVTGAVFSGLAMVVTIVVPLGWWLGLREVWNPALLDRLGMLMLATGLGVAYAYVCEGWSAFFAGDDAERRMLFHVRPFGPHAPMYWIMIFGNVVAPQILWLRRARRSPVAILAVALAVDVSMWAERLVLIVTSQERDFLPSSWRDWLPSPVDAALFVGTLGFFVLLTLLVVRLVPVAAISELKEERRADDALRASERRALGVADA